MLNFIKQKLAESDQEFSEESKKILEAAEQSEDVSDDIIAEYAKAFGGIDEVSVDGNGDTSKFIIEGDRSLDLTISLFEDDIDLGTIELDLTSGRAVDVPMDAQVASKKEEFKAASTFEDFYNVAADRMYPMARESEAHFESRVMEAAEKEFDAYLKMCKEQGLYQYQHLAITDEDVPNRVLIESADSKIPVKVSFGVDDNGEITHKQLENLKAVVASHDMYKPFIEAAEDICPGAYPVSVSVVDDETMVFEFETNEEPLFISGTKTDVMESYSTTVDDGDMAHYCVNKRTAIKFLAEKFERAKNEIAREPKLKRKLDGEDEYVTEAIDFGNTPDAGGDAAGGDAANAIPDLPDVGGDTGDADTAVNIGGDAAGALPDAPGGDAAGALPDTPGGNAAGATPDASTDINDISNDISNAITNDVANDPANGGMGEPTFTGNENNVDPMNAIGDAGPDMSSDTSMDTSLNDIGGNLDSLTNDAMGGDTTGTDGGFAGAVNLDTMSMDQITQIGIKKLRSLPMEQLKNFINGSYNESAFDEDGNFITESKNIFNDINDHIVSLDAVIDDKSKDLTHRLGKLQREGQSLNKLLSKAAKKGSDFSQDEIEKLNDLNQSVIGFMTSIKTKNANEIRPKFVDYKAKAKVVQQMVQPKMAVKPKREIPEGEEDSLLYKDGE